MKTAKRTLNVKVTTIGEITENWGFTPCTPFMEVIMPVYVRCNVKGQVNWEKTSIYNHMDLIGKIIRIHK